MGNIRINGYSDISAAIMAELGKYSDNVASKVDEAVDNQSKKLLSDIKQNSPKKTGRYKKGWKRKIVGNRFGCKKYIIHNATDYQLTHLLENGHATANGTGRVGAVPHIAPAEQKAVEEFTAEVERILHDND